MNFSGNKTALEFIITTELSTIENYKKVEVKKSNVNP